MPFTNDQTKHIRHSETLAEFLAEVARVASDCTGATVVLWRDDQAWSYQFGLDGEELKLSAKVLNRFAKLELAGPWDSQLH